MRRMMAVPTVLAFVAVSALVAQAAEPEVVPGSLADLARFRKPPREVTMVQDGFLWVDAEDFADYGQWRLDTQFVYLTGSAYLLAGGVGTPIGDAVTEIQIPRPGRYRVWVRAKNWLKDYSPGKFAISVGNERAQHVFGAAGTQAWTWESAGEFDLKAGRVRLALHDLTGYFARCDALILTTDLRYRPPDDMAAYQRERNRLTGLRTEPKEAREFDVVVVGAGPAGCCAALAAARLGAKTALVQDRPVLGGNASTELGVPICGASVHHANARESGLIEEMGLIRAANSFPKMSEAFQMAARAEKNLTVFFNQRVIGAELEQSTPLAPREEGGSSGRSVTSSEQDPSRRSVTSTLGRASGYLTAARAVDTLTGEPSVYRGRLFVDCTGDGWLGYYAGAEYRLGREGRDEFNEDLAPPEADKITMSGCIMGNLSLSYRAVDAGRPIKYAPPPWAAKLPPADQFGRTIKGFTGGQWWLEHRGQIDDLFDAERARDELVRITFGYWDYIKNAWPARAQAANYAMVYVPHVNAKRETRRLVGDYILTQQDALEGRMFPDRISYGGWPMDVHHPEGIYSGQPGPYYCNPRVPIYSIPYRSLYSVNIENLLFAGRDMSVTHIALGTVRVEGTLATLGQAAGTAAALCLQHSVTPRELGRQYVGELQQTLLKHDQYIPELKNEDPADLARAAAVAASSTASHTEFTREEVRGGERHELTTSRAMMFPCGLTERLRSICLLLSSERAEPVDMTLHLRTAAAAGDFSSAHDLATSKAVVRPGRESFVEFLVDCAVKEPYVWVWLPKTPGVSWRLMGTAPTGSRRAYGGGSGRPWTVVTGQHYALFTDPVLRYATDYRPENVIDGVTRIVDATSHLWVSDPREPLPQWVELTFPKPVELNTVCLTFDTDLNPRFVPGPLVPQCVRDYRLSAFDGREWTELAAVKDNFLRRRIHRLDTVTASKLRLTVEATHGDPTARVFEIRAYREP